MSTKARNVWPVITVQWLPLITIIDIFTLTANLCRPYKSLLTLTVNMITNNNKLRCSLELKMLPIRGVY